MSGSILRRCRSYGYGVQFLIRNPVNLVNRKKGTVAVDPTDTPESIVEREMSIIKKKK